MQSSAMRVCDQCRATSAGAPIALCPLKSLLPIVPWTPLHAATETCQTASHIPGEPGRTPLTVVSPSVLGTLTAHPACRRGRGLGAPRWSLGRWSRASLALCEARRMAGPVQLEATRHCTFSQAGTPWHHQSRRTDASRRHRAEPGRASRPRPAPGQDQTLLMSIPDSTSEPPFVYVRGAPGTVKRKGSPGFRPAREPGAMANTIV